MIVPGTDIVVPDLTRTQLDLLRRMVKASEHEPSDDDEYEEGELVVERGQTWLGLERVPMSTVYALLRACAVSPVAGNEPGAQVERYVATETGRAILHRHAQEERPRSLPLRLRGTTWPGRRRRPPRISRPIPNGTRRGQREQGQGGNKAMTTLVVLCAWCEQEQPTILTLCEGEELSHGICARHAARLRAELDAEPHRKEGNKSLDSPADGGLPWPWDYSSRHWEELAGGPDRLVGLMKSYADSSAAGGIASVAMFIGRAVAWDSIEKKWRDATKGLGSLPFRMTNFISTEKDPQRRLDMLLPLIEIIHEASPMAAVTVMNEAVWALLPTLVTVRLGGSVYMNLATGTLWQVAKWRMDNGHQDPLVCVFESGTDEKKSEFGTVSRIILDQSESFRKEFGIEDIVFAPKGRAGLSMADMLAWIMTHWVPELRVGIDDELCGPLLTKLDEKTRVFRMYLTRDFLIQRARENSWDNVKDFCKQYGITPPGQSTSQ